MEIAHNRRILRLDTVIGRADAPRPRLASIFAIFLLLAVVHTWPLATAPQRLSRNDNADAILNEWIVAWIAHQAPRDPMHLADANIYYPEPRTLAYSELLLPPAIAGAPLAWLGASPVLVYNILVLLGFAATASAAFVLIHRWTGDCAAGFVGGVIVAFNAHTLTRLPQLQALHLEFLPLALLAFDRIADNDRTSWRDPAALGVCVALQGLTSYYSLVFTCTALAIAWLVRPDAWRPSVAARMLAAGAIAAVPLAPMLWIYWRLGVVRPLDEVAQYSAELRDYLATPARMHYGAWSAPFFGGTTALFPGVTAMALTAVALASGVLTRDRRARTALAFGIVGFALSFGPALPGYAALYHAIPPLQGIRNAARFGYLAFFAMGILAGYGLAWIRQRWSRARWLPFAIAVAIVAANLDALSAPIEYVDVEAVSPLHAVLRGTTAIVAEFPFYPPDRLFRHAPYLLHSTYHWRPMLNGYSGLAPASFVEHAQALARFPDDRAIATLRALGVTHVFVHDRALRGWTDNETADAVPGAPGLERVGSDGDLALYRVR